jgi:hypothetical protein
MVCNGEPRGSRLFAALLAFEADKGVLLMFGELRPVKHRERVITLHLHVGTSVFGVGHGSVGAMILKGENTAGTRLMCATTVD